MKDSDVGWWIIAYMVFLLLGFAAALTFSFPIWIGVLVGGLIPGCFQLGSYLLGRFLVYSFEYTIDVLTGKRK